MIDLPGERFVEIGLKGKNWLGNENISKPDAKWSRKYTDWGFIMDAWLLFSDNSHPQDKSVFYCKHIM